MSVQKYVISKSVGNFTTLPNKVLQNLKNYEALGLYCYLASLPTGWEFYKSQLREHGNIGIHKLNYLLKILEKHNLISTAQVRNSKGHFSHFVLQVFDGTDFKINELENNSTPCYNNRNTVTVATVISTYKGNTYKENKNKEKRERGKKKDVLSLVDKHFDFTQDEIAFAKEHTLDLSRELKIFQLSLKEKNKDPINIHAAFMTWLYRGSDFKKSKQGTRCTIPFFKEKNPERTTHQLELDRQAAKIALSQIRGIGILKNNGLVHHEQST